MARASGTLPVVKDRAGFEHLLKELHPKLAELVPDERTLRRLKMLALVAASKQPKLYLCTISSLAFGIMWAAELGLDFSGALKQASLIPFKNGKTGQYEAVPMIEWRGLRDKALESAHLAGMKITGLRAQAVRANDDYGYQDINPDTLRPRWWHTKVRGDRGELVAAYATWVENGEPQVDWMWAEEINKRRACSRNQSRPDSVWNTWPDEMWEKTVMRDAVEKRLPISYEARTAIATALAPEEKSGLSSYDIDIAPEEQQDTESDEGGELPLREEAT